MVASEQAVRAIPELALIERAVGYTRMSLMAAPGADPASPTPCARWDLLTLLTHMLESLEALEEAGRVGRVSTSLPAALAKSGTREAPDPALGRLTAALTNQACGLLGAWSAGGGERLVDVSGSPMRSGVLAAAGALEIAVHGWDVGVACGLDHPIPEALAADLCAYLPLLVQSSDRPERFAPRLPVPAGARHAVRLLAELGRRDP